MRLRLFYVLAATVVFAIELAIARFVHDGFVRPYLGDVMAVILVYLAVRAVTPLRVVPAILAALAFALAIELGQLFDLVGVLGLRGTSFGVMVLGGVFDWKDIGCYLAGAVIVLIVEFARGETGWQRAP